MMHLTEATEGLDVSVYTKYQPSTSTYKSGRGSQSWVPVHNTSVFGIFCRFHSCKTQKVLYLDWWNLQRLHRGGMFLGTPNFRPLSHFKSRIEDLKVGVSAFNSTDFSMICHFHSYGSQKVFDLYRRNLQRLQRGRTSLCKANFRSLSPVQSQMIELKFGGPAHNKTDSDD